jgi:hypothetical protein
MAKSKAMTRAQPKKSGGRPGILPPLGVDFETALGALLRTPRPRRAKQRTNRRLEGGRRERRSDARGLTAKREIPDMSAVMTMKPAIDGTGGWRLLFDVSRRASRACHTTTAVWIVVNGNRCRHAYLC